MTKKLMPFFFSAAFDERAVAQRETEDRSIEDAIRFVSSYGEMGFSLSGFLHITRQWLANDARTVVVKGHATPELEAASTRDKDDMVKSEK